MLGLKFSLLLSRSSFQKLKCFKPQISRRLFSTEIDKILNEAPKPKEKEVKLKGVQPQGKTKRWYKEVSVEHFSYGSNSGYQVLLDKRVVKTPGDNKLLLPTAPLAYGIAYEWEKQGTKILPVNMPLMILSCTSIDEMSKKRTVCIDTLLSYLRTDCTIIRDPVRDLRKRQAEIHDPLLLWLSKQYNVPLLPTGTELKLPDPPEETVTIIQWSLFSEDDWVLTGLDFLARNFKSLVIALALWKGHITAEQAIHASRIEENFQIEAHGEVEGNHDIDVSQIAAEVSNAAFFLHNLKKIE